MMKRVASKQRLINEVHLKEFLLAFFTILIFSCKNVYILNIVFMAILFMQIVKRKRIEIMSEESNKYLLAYIIWTIVDSGIVLVVEEYDFCGRNIIQILFDVQYLFLLIYADFDLRRYLKWVIIISSIYSCIVIYEFFSTGTYMHLRELFVVPYRIWGDEFFPGNVITTPVPLLFALFIAFYVKSPVIIKILISLGALAFPARVSLFGVLGLWIYFLGKRIKPPCNVILILISIGMIFNLAWIGDQINSTSPALFKRLMAGGDRASIAEDVIHFFRARPILGYGGRTLGQLYIYDPSYVSDAQKHVPDLQEWPQPHNVIWESLLRYGIVGTVFFLLFLYKYFLSVRDKDLKFMYYVMFMMGFFQTYFRNFVFLFIIYIIKQMYQEKEKIREIL